MSASSPLVGVFDAGIGGIPLAAMLDRRGYRIVYVGDAARRPYGPQSAEAVAGYLAEAERFFESAECDAWVIACNTASVVADRALRRTIPCVDMVSSVMHAYPATGSGKLGLLGTAGTVTSGVFVRALATYDLRQVATEELLRLAEEGGSDPRLTRALAAEAFAALADHGCNDVILACTDFTCVLDDLHAVAGDLRLVDPLEEAVQLVEDLVPRPESAAVRTPHRLVLSGEHPVDVPTYARDRFALDLPQPEYRPLSCES